jgi:hypothetical protein
MPQQAIIELFRALLPFDIASFREIDSGINRLRMAFSGIVA